MEVEESLSLTEKRASCVDEARGLDAGASGRGRGAGSALTSERDGSTSLSTSGGTKRWREED